MTLTQLIGARKAREHAYRRRRTFANDVSEMFVTKTKRGVRITVVTHVDKIVGRPPALVAGTGFHCLDDDQVERLIRRLTAIRGGKRRTHTSRGNRRTP